MGLDAARLIKQLIMWVTRAVQVIEGVALALVWRERATSVVVK